MVNQYSLIMYGCSTSYSKQIPYKANLWTPQPVVDCSREPRDRHKLGVAIIVLEEQ